MTSTICLCHWPPENIKTWLHTSVLHIQPRIRAHTELLGQHFVLCPSKNAREHWPLLCSHSQLIAQFSCLFTKKLKSFLLKNVCMDDMDTSLSVVVWKCFSPAPSLWGMITLPHLQRALWELRFCSDSDLLLLQVYESKEIFCFHLHNSSANNGSGNK